jgi:hypothetical protein
MSQTQLDTDNFSGTAATVLHTYNGKWKTIAFKNDCQISTPNGGVGGDGSADYNDGQTWTNDQWAELVAVNSGSDKAGVMIRMQTGNNAAGYFAGSDQLYGDTKYRLVRFASNTEDALLQTSASKSFTNGDVINLEAVGSTITVRINGVVELQQTDTTYSTGYPGILLTNSGDATLKLLTTWRAGSVTADGAQPTLVPVKRMVGVMYVQG